MRSNVLSEWLLPLPKRAASKDAPTTGGWMRMRTTSLPFWTYLRAR